MRNRILAALICTAAVMAAGCGGGTAGNGTQEAAQSAVTASESAEAEPAQAQEGATQETASETEDSDRAARVFSAAGETYESEDGWTVRYNSDLVEVNETRNGTEFVYIGDSEGTNKFVIKYLPNTSTDIVLADKTADYNGSWLERSEGYFAGRADLWAFHADVIRNGRSSTLGYTAVEHNDGVLLIEKTGSVESDEEQGQLISDTMADILDSLEFEDHEPQTEYDYIPGRYVLAKDSISGDPAAYPAEIVLNEDHTGSIGAENAVKIIWYSRDGILKEDKEGGEIRFYTIEGDSLYLQQGDEWVEYRKSIGAGQSADGIAADSRTAASFRTYENDDGWLVYYDKDLFTIEEKWNSVEFIYGDSEDDADKLIVRYIEDDSTEDVLEDLERGYDSAEIERSEGYMGGSREDWSFTISVPAKDEEEGVRKVYTVSEHNGGVLVAERTSSGENADEREKAIEGIVDTFLFTDHAPQIEYEEIPGRYVLNDKILSKDASNYPKFILLKADHSGVIGDSEETEIVWHCTDGLLKESAAGGKTYQYYIDDEVLYLQMEGEWVQFDREGDD